MVRCVWGCMVRCVWGVYGEVCAGITVYVYWV